MAATTLAQIVGEICQSYKKLYATGTTSSSGSTTTAIASSLIGKDISNGHYITVSSAERLITAFDTTTGTVTFTPAASGAVASGVTYIITPRSWSDLVQVVNRSIRAMGDNWRIQVVDDTSLTFNSTTQTYSLPTACMEVSGIFLNVASTTDTSITQYVPFTKWDVFTHSDGTRKLMLRDSTGNLNGISVGVRLIYYALPSLLTATTDTLGFAERDERDAIEFIVNNSLSLLLEADIANAPTDSSARGWNEIGTRAKTRAEAIRSNYHRLIRPVQVRRYSVARHI